MRWSTEIFRRWSQQSRKSLLHLTWMWVWRWGSMSGSTLQSSLIASSMQERASCWSPCLLFSKRMMDADATARLMRRFLSQRTSQSCCIWTCSCLTVKQNDCSKCLDWTTETSLWFCFSWRSFALSVHNDTSYFLSSLQQVSRFKSWKICLWTMMLMSTDTHWTQSKNWLKSFLPSCLICASFSDWVLPCHPHWSRTAYCPALSVWFIRHCSNFTAAKQHLTWVCSQTLWFLSWGRLGSVHNSTSYWILNLERICCISFWWLCI